MKELYPGDDEAVSRVEEFITRYQTSNGSDRACEVPAFQKLILDYYKKYRREFPWREKCSPYEIFVSEVMLQQTQTERVIDKFTAFIEAMPTLCDLAHASPGDVLALWQGLGYNRRAVFLHKAAKIIADHYNGKIPRNPEELVKLPGIGKATAASIAVYAYNRPEIFIETNIRTVFIHFFFHERDAVGDDEILPLVEKNLYRKNPSQWYSALMDFGVMLKRNIVNPSRKSKHHTKQSKFEGSRRQLRGRILKTLLQHGSMNMKKLAAELQTDLSLVKDIADDLSKEGLIIVRGGRLSLPEK